MSFFPLFLSFYPFLLFPFFSFLLLIFWCFYLVTGKRLIHFIYFIVYVRRCRGDEVTEWKISVGNSAQLAQSATLFDNFWQPPFFFFSNIANIAAFFRPRGTSSRVRIKWLFMIISRDVCPCVRNTLVRMPRKMKTIMILNRLWKWFWFFYLFAKNF